MSQNKMTITIVVSFSQFSCSVMSDSLQPHELQHARPPCPSPTPRIHPNPCPLSRWCHPTISSSIAPFSSCPQSFTAPSVQEENITIVNIYALNIGAAWYIRQTLRDIKEEIDSNTIAVGEFNTLLTPMDRLSKQKINKKTQVLNDTLDEMDFIDIFRTFHPTTEEYTFFSSDHGTFSRKDHILGYKSNLSKFEKVEINQAPFLTTAVWD